MFSRPVKQVASTSIYARPDGPRQWLAYQMVVDSVDEVAMVLPLPVPPDASDDAVRFHDLSGYPDLFDDLARAWPEEVYWSRSEGTQFLASSAPRLKVHTVGDFDASFVPRPSDFDRLDPRFRLGEAVLGELPQYADWGFAVFQLRQERPGWFARLLGRSFRRQVHPMALSFPTRHPGRVFYPTVHVHDGRVQDKAWFDHTLYLQGAEAPDGRWDPAHEPVGAVVDVEKTGGMVTSGAGHRAVLTGLRANEDVWVEC